MAHSVDRNLLFGLLALQTGMIDQSALLTAFHGWTRDKSRSIADLLLAQSAVDDTDRELLEGLVGQHLKRYGNNIETSLAALTTPRTTVDELIAAGDADLNVTLGYVVGSTSRQTEQSVRADAGATMSVAGSAGQGQRFRVLRPHAKGGLGAVFVALDGELNREVALKQILDHAADDPTSRQRFLLEAEITGGLEHPGIVPVYGLGAYKDGRPYYAMRFIRGDSLKEAIDRFHKDDSFRADPGARSLELRKLLRRFTDVCNAIEYAHSRGVLHRDIKPGNIVVGKHGETLVVDWGLARARGRNDAVAENGEATLMPSSASGSAETLPGQAMGTPAYMSPEQARGDLDALGPRSDVYSLGATLHCLLTGKTPFEGDVFEVLRKVQNGEFSKPRQIDATIDPPLEAVCLKAMATQPGDRYASCRALAEDVERWAADEPVTAYREPFVRRTRRWANRNRTAVTAAAVALIAGVVGLSAVAAVQSRANTRLKAVNGDLAVANAKVTRVNGDLAASVQREQARFKLAMEAIRMFHSGVSEDLLLKQKEFGTLRTKLLEGAKGFYQKLEGLLHDDTDSQSRWELGRVYGELAELTGQLGSLSDALALRGRALAIFEDLGKTRQDDRDIQVDVLRNRSDLAMLLWSTGQKAEGLAMVNPLLRLTEAQLDACDPSDLDRQFNLTKVLHEQAAFTAYESHGQKGLDVLRKAKASLENLVRSRPSSKPYRLELASVCDSLAMALDDQRMNDEAMATYERGRELGEALFEANPNDAKIGQELLRILGNMAVCLESANQIDRAIAIYEQALTLIATTEAANPALRATTRNRAWIEANLSSDLQQLGRDDEALSRLEHARSARQMLVKADPSVLRDQEELVRILIMMADIQWREGRVTEARTAVESALELISRIGDVSSNNPNLQSSKAVCQGRLADLDLAVGKTSEALAWSNQAVAIERGLFQDTPSVASTLADLLRRRGVILQKHGEAALAAAAFRESIRLLEGLADPASGNIYDLARSHSLLSGLDQKPGAGLPPNERLAEAEKAMKALHSAIAMGWRNPSRMNIDADLDPIRGRPEFQLLIMDLAMPKEPFARSK